MYTVKVLTEKDFDALPYKHAKTSLGLADAKTGVAYVRDTGYNDITKGTIEHELDELMAKVSPHEEDGIRYKNLASLGAGAGTGLLTSFFPKLQSFSPVISAGVGAAVNKDKNYLQGALQGLTGGGLAQGLKGGVSGGISGLTSPGGTFGKALEGFLPGVESGLQGYMEAIPGMGPGGKLSNWLSGNSTGGTISAATKTAMPTGNKGQPYTPFSMTTPSGYTGSTITPGVNPNAPATGGSNALSSFSIGDQFKKLIPSLAIAGIGDIMAPKVEAPDLSGVIGNLKNQVATGGEPLAKELGMTELTRGLTSPINTPPTNAFDLGDIENEQAKQEALTNYVNHFKSIRPGADFKNDPEFLRGYTDIQERYDRVRQAQRDATTFEYVQQQLQQKYNYMQTALNLNETQIGQYVQIAQLEVGQIMAEYGVDVETAAKFKEMFADLAQLQYTGGTQRYTLDDLFNLGKKQQTA